MLTHFVWLALSAAVALAAPVKDSGTSNLCGPDTNYPEGITPFPPNADPTQPEKANFDYIVVGAGAAGGPLAARLAENGKRVLLLDAGGHYYSLNVSTPAMNQRIVEDPNISWDYSVAHYPASTGYGQNVFYPRASGVGGCTLHHVMVAMYPHPTDWDNIAQITGDDTWTDQHMRQLFIKMEKNLYPSFFSSSGHGYDGWFPTSYLEAALPQFPKVLFDGQLRKVIETFVSYGKWAAGFDINGHGNNMNKDNRVLLVPQSNEKGVRKGVRERVLDVLQKYPDNLVIWSHALVTKVIVEGSGDNLKATGVEYSLGSNLYRASPLHNQAQSTSCLQKKYVVKTNGEVILSAGSYNSPQLLMLSGIGDEAQLTKFNISVVKHLPGVGKNLQDRYEISQNLNLKEDTSLLQGCTFNPESGSDPCMAKYQQAPSKHFYGTNGVLIGMSTMTDPSLAAPDVFLFGGPSYFEGYHHGYSVEAYAAPHNKWVWAMLKAHTNNTLGTVELQSADPRDIPNINFNYFADGDSDLQAMVKQFNFLRQISGTSTFASLIVNETAPGNSVQTDEQIADYIRKNAWGHHACCSAKIGSDDDPMAVLDGDFKVRGVANLRVVDASSFPKIPGFFIAIPIHMIGERAAAVLLGQDF